MVDRLSVESLSNSTEDQSSKDELSTLTKDKDQYDFLNTTHSAKSNTMVNFISILKNLVKKPAMRGLLVLIILVLLMGIYISIPKSATISIRTETART